jgi:hypothetical protein
MRAVIVAASLALVACGPSSFEAFVEGHLTGDEDDCGSLRTGQTGPEVDTARQCVDDHVAAEQPFVVRWEELGINYDDPQAMSGGPRDGGYERFMFTSGSDDETWHATEFRCADLQETTPCPDENDAPLCYVCVGPVEVDHAGGRF